MKNARGTSLIANICVFAVLILVFVVAVGCQAETTTMNEVVELAPVETAELEPAVSTVSTENLVQTADTLAQETAIDECLACHIDKEQLIATADPEEEVINENEGEG